jgi:hypothetical protein
MRDPFPPHTRQYLLLLVFLMIAILIEVRWNLSVVLIYMSFIAGDGEHFFMFSLATCISSFEKGQFSSVSHFFIGSLLWREISFLCSLYILVISPLSDV